MPENVSLKHFLNQKDKSVTLLPIFLRITYTRKKAELYTGHKCLVKDWNQDNQVTKNSAMINKELLDQKAKVMQFFIDLQKEGKNVSANLLKDLLTGKARVKTRLLDYLDAYIQELSIRGQIKPISLNKYKQSRSSLAEFISSKYGLQDLPIEKITFEFINSYDLFLKQAYNLHKNTINKYHSRLRTLLLRAHAEGLLAKQPYSNFKLVSVKTDREFLNEVELKKIVDVNLSHNKSLDKVRDLFIFSCYTGLRFQDAQNLTTDNLTVYKGKPFIRYAQEKTGSPVDIPVLPIVKKIFEKYQGEPERVILNKLLPKISNQKVNSYLKIVADQAGVHKKITHHVARHTFATTVCLNNGMPLEDVSKLLGHSSLKTTQVYGRITQDRLQKSMEKINKKM
ncbi:MAG TPA: site-specific integrase [Puia sp.]|nr:site-specific integrase [Puia sp.]